MKRLRGAPVNVTAPDRMPRRVKKFDEARNAKQHADTPRPGRTFPTCGSPPVKDNSEHAPRKDIFL